MCLDSDNGTCLGNYLVHKIKASKQPDKSEKFPKDFNINLDDVHLPNTDLDDPENYVVKKVKKPLQPGHPERREPTAGLDAPLSALPDQRSPRGRRASCRGRVLEGRQTHTATLGAGESVRHHHCRLEEDHFYLGPGGPE